MMHSATEHVIRLFEQRGQGRYGSEQVSQLQHALQCAVFAKRQGAGSAMIAAALLHDLGHIIDHQPMPESDNQNLDDAHEQRAYQWIKSNFGKSVADPVRLHVAAKRYLCTVEPEYLAKLSPASLKSFHDQGGLMSQSQIDDFRDEPFAFEAVELRRWDDLAKDPTMQTPAIDDFAPLLDHLVEDHQSARSA
jgi:[1-hydroxy-2-(trimethylamino)ethyl]phosphonate dioxygenase